MVTATGSTKARNGKGRRLSHHQSRMLQPEVDFLNQKEW
jgi:hypothetical protein